MFSVRSVFFVLALCYSSCTVGALLGSHNHEELSCCQRLVGTQADQPCWEKCKGVFWVSGPVISTFALSVGDIIVSCQAAQYETPDLRYISAALTTLSAITRAAIPGSYLIRYVNADQDGRIRLTPAIFQSTLLAVRLRSLLWGVSYLNVGLALLEAYNSDNKDLVRGLEYASAAASAVILLGTIVVMVECLCFTRDWAEKYNNKFKTSYWFNPLPVIKSEGLFPTPDPL